MAASNMTTEPSVGPAASDDRSLQDKVEGLQRSVTGFGFSLDKLTERVGELEERPTSVVLDQLIHTGRQRVQEELDKSQQQVEVLRKQVESLQEEITRQQESFKVKSDKDEQKILDLQTDLRKIKEIVSEKEEQIQKLQENLKDMSSKVDTNSHKLAKTEQELTLTKEQLSSTQKELSSTQKELTLTTQHLTEKIVLMAAQQQAKFDDIEAKLTKITHSQPTDSRRSRDIPVQPQPSSLPPPVQVQQAPVQYPRTQGAVQLQQRGVATGSTNPPQQVTRAQAVPTPNYVVAPPSGARCQSTPFTRRRPQE